jgi:LuxR family maltose regulon positive regulatory protein
VAEYHIRASQWYEDNGLELEAFQHAAAANDVERAERIIEGKGIPLHVRGALVPVLNWLASLPKTVLDARPSLGVMYATLALMAGQTTGVEEKLRAAEAALAAALQGAEPVDKTRDLIGQIAAARVTLSLTRYQPEALITQAHRALEYLHPDNLPSRVRAIWTLGFAYQVQGDRAAARQAFTEAVAISQASGNIRFTIVATISLAVIQEFENHLYQAVETYRGGLQLAGDYPQPFENEAHLGLARILYEWNDLEAAEQHGQQGLQLARQLHSVIDRFVICEVFLARLKLAQGDVAGAAAMLAETEQSVRQNNFVHRIPEVAAAQVLVLLRQGDLPKAAHIAQTHDLPFSLARVHLAQGDPSEALAVLGPLRQQMETKGWVDEQLKVMVLQAVAFYAHGEKDKAVQLLGEVLTLAALVGFSRIYLGDHYPGDVLSGALSGMAFAESVQRVQQAVMRAADSDIG